MNRYPTVLSIAGSDSGGGAGIQADIKTISALGAYATTAITALTAQNTIGVVAIHEVPAAFLKSQIEAIFDDITVDSVKIGMVSNIEIAYVISQALYKYNPKFVVFDPVMVSTSGARLIEEKTVDQLWKLLFSKVDLITPNLDEAEILVGHPIRSKIAMQKAAEEMVERGCNAVLLKGGHLIAEKLYDVFAQKGNKTLLMETPYIESNNVHGTGCTLSSAIATYYAMDLSLTESILLAKNYISDAIKAGKDVVTGHGHGPLNHTYSPLKMFLK